MCLVGRDEARQGQLVAKPVTQSAQPVGHQEQDRESHREKYREMLSRAKEFVGDDDQLLAEYQQDTVADISIDIDIESASSVASSSSVSSRVASRVASRMDSSMD